MLINQKNGCSHRSVRFLTVKVKITRTLQKPLNSALINPKPECIISLVLKYLHGIFMSKYSDDKKEKGIEGGNNRA